MSETVIVVIEDDTNIADLVDLYLRREGYRVLLHSDGEAGIAAVATHGARLVLLDIGLGGGIDGFEVCRRLRASGNSLGVIMLTARDDEIDRVLGLELGADDYVTKPFSPRELAARVKALLRRSESSARHDAPAVHDIGDLRVDLGRREATLAGEAVPLAAREFDLLAHLVQNRGLALSRRQLLDGVWGPGWIGDERTVDVHVRQLRKKLGDSFALTTVWGVGYRLD
ncbi:MAG: response regulator transcription factor [Microthrixaceae bacterium]|nr:response regulator transcription factor [Microthrixaceae bacterium]